VREHNEDAHFLDLDLGMFLVCDGMGGHAAGEVASALAIGSIRQEWSRDGLRKAAEHWLERGTPEAKKQLLEVVRAGVVAAHGAILAEAERDEAKRGMGTTLVGAIVVGGELVFAHAGDSRAYLVRDGISMQLTEDHTLLARLLAAGIDVDLSGEGSRFRSMLTNALGIGEECKVSTFVVPLADGDRFLLCSDGISEYVPENEVGDVLTKQSNPARAAQRLIELALKRGGGDNATAVVVCVLEAGKTPLPAEQRRRDDAAISACTLWGTRVTPQQRLRALRIAIPRDHNCGEKLPPHALGDRVAWIVVEGELVQDGLPLGPGALVYPESLVNTDAAAPPPDRDALAITRSDVRALAIRADDFRELCDDDGELGEALLESLAQVIAQRRTRGAGRAGRPPVDRRGTTSPHVRPVARAEVADACHPTAPDLPAVTDPTAHAAPVPDDDPALSRAQLPTRPRPQAESPIIAPVPPPQASPQPSSPPQLAKQVSPPAQAPSRPGPPPRSKQPSVPPPARPTPAQAAAALPHTPAAVHGIPKAPTAGARRPPTPAVGTPPLERTATHPRPSSSPAAATSALNPQADAGGDATPPRAGTRADSASAIRLSIEPEIEAYLEIEAELPPEPGSALDLESDLAPSDDFYGKHASVSITIADDSTRVTETVTETDSQTLTLTVTEPSGDHDPVRPRAITAEDAAAVSGTIHANSGPPRRAGRHREGHEE
jgi:serine/threonine protein phosphatase PrpC